MPTPFRIRRATIDDRPGLIALWKKNQLPSESLDQRFTDFQLAEDDKGRIVGALALQLASHQGLIHSEAFDDFGLADQLRPMLWERIQSVARNHGLFRIWTYETAPFWSQSNFIAPSEELMARLPSEFASEKRVWRVWKIKDESSPGFLSMEQHLELFKQSQKQESEKRFAQAKVLKIIATLIALVLFMIVFGGIFYLMKNKSRLPQRPQNP